MSYHSFPHSGHNNRPIRQQNDKEHLPQRPLDRVRKADEPERYRLRPKFLSLQRADLYVIEYRHKVCGDFCHFLFGYGIGRILFTTLKATAMTNRSSDLDLLWKLRAKL
jgi:hypothetical protein